jgi:DNA polymerase-3 subunit epsilon
MYIPDFRADRQEAAKWAADLPDRDDWVILDTETTGFSGRAEVIQISLINPKGEPLLNTLVKPLREIGAEAAAVNGITIEKCESAPVWPDVFPKFCEIVAGKTVIIYNRDFDVRIIKQSCRDWELDDLGFWGQDGTSLECAMLMYSQWVGEWSWRRGNYKWQKLPGGDHSAQGDCLATLEIIRHMAASYHQEVA